jgi:hypothetical protein
MATKDDVFAKEIETLRKDVTRLRDEIRVKLHLGAMDARDSFAQIEHQVEHAARDASQTTKHALELAHKQLRVLAEAFRSPTTPSNGKSAP